MNCENCAAPLKLVPDRDYLFCEYCGAFHFLAQSEDGVAISQEATELMCPLCGIALVQASLDGSIAWHCARCRGTLTRQVVFRQVVEARRSRSNVAAQPIKPLNQCELTRHIECPVCHREMATHPYYGPGNVVIDNCSGCHLLWLDFGELTRVVNAPGSDRGRPRSAPKAANSVPPPKPNDDFEALLDFFWPGVD